MFQNVSEHQLSNGKKIQKPAIFALFLLNVIQ